MQAQLLQHNKDLKLLKDEGSVLLTAQGFVWMAICHRPPELLPTPSMSSEARDPARSIPPLPAPAATSWLQSPEFGCAI